LGLGQQCRTGALARLGRGRPDQAPPSDRIRRSPGRFARIKKPTPRALGKTLESFAPVLSLSSQPSTTEREREQRPWRARRWSEPWRRRRPPRRRACSPTGEHAAVERPGHGAPFSEPSEQLPRFGLSSPARRRDSNAARRRGKPPPSPSFPCGFDSLFLFFDSTDWG